MKQRYQVIQKLDAGGMAEIFKGRALSLDGIQKPVAIKRILPSLSNNQRFVKMFIDEARLCMRLTHANIVQVFDVGRADGTYFLVMELVDGINLRRLFQKASELGRKLPPAAAVHIALEVCKALSHAHDAKDEAGTSLDIVHRDVSPPNILISWSGEVKITDFGLAKAVSQLERTDPGVVKGKFSYLSPEVAEGKQADPRADIFSLGVVIHEILTGRRLFMGKSDLDTVELVKKCQVPTPSSLTPEVPAELDAIVLKALARDRRKRWQSAKEFADALAGFLFSHNLKFTQYDLANLVKSIQEDGAVTEKPAARIKDLIRDEVLSLSIIGALPNPFPTGRADPLNADELDDPKSTSLDDMWDDWTNAPPGGGSGASGFDKLIEAPQQDISILTGGAAKGKRALPWLWISLAVFLGLSVSSIVILLHLSDQLVPLLNGYTPDIEAIKALFFPPR